MNNYKIGDTFEHSYPPDAAIWCNSNDAYIKQMPDGAYQILGIPTPTQRELDEQKIYELQKYLSDTDWYVSRYAETGVVIPDDIKMMRQEARKLISDIRDNNQLDIK